MTASVKVLVVGASGFIGRAVVEALETDGHTVTKVKAPRLGPMDETTARAFIAESPIVDELVGQFSAQDAVVNAAGNPDASCPDAAALTAANAVLPGLLAAAVASTASSPRFVQVSSAVVQGRAPVLDDSTDTDPFSAYARSKTLGEQLVLELAPGQAVVYRPPSVHALDRRVTRMIGAIARSPLATVSRPGCSPSPQALLPNVASAIAFLATTPQRPPSIVTHPSEQVTTSGLMEALGGRRPRELPRPVATAAVRGLTMLSRAAPRLAADARRVEMLWFGQGQAESWLTRAGWCPPAGPEAWERLGAELRREAALSARHEGPSS